MANTKTTDVGNGKYRALCHTQLSHIIFLHCANRTPGVHLAPMLAALRNKSNRKLYKSPSRSQLVHAVCTTSLQATLATCLSAQAAKPAKTANTRLNKTFQNQNHIPILFQTSKSFQARGHVLQNNEHRSSRGNTLHTMQTTSKLIPSTRLLIWPEITFPTVGQHGCFSIPLDNSCVTVVTSIKLYFLLKPFGSSATKKPLRPKATDIRYLR